MVDTVKNLALNEFINSLNEFINKGFDEEGFWSAIEKQNERYPADFLLTKQGNKYISGFDDNYKRQFNALSHKYNRIPYPLGFINTVYHETGIWYETFTFCYPWGHNRSYEKFTKQDVLDDIFSVYKDNLEAVNKIKEIVEWFKINDFEFIADCD